METPDNDPLAAWPPEPPATHESTYAPIHESTYAEISRLATAAPFGGAPTPPARPRSATARPQGVTVVGEPLAASVGGADAAGVGGTVAAGRARDEAAAVVGRVGTADGRVDRHGRRPAAAAVGARGQPRGAQGGDAQSVDPPVQRGAARAAHGLDPPRPEAAHGRRPRAPNRWRVAASRLPEPRRPRRGRGRSRAPRRRDAATLAAERRARCAWRWWRAYE